MLALPYCLLLLLLPQKHRCSLTEEVFQWWGEWSSWSSCTRSCGGGVRSQERHCLIQRLSSSHHGNGSFCVGSPKKYQLCPNQVCPKHSSSFKQHQCSQFNSRAFGRRHHQWIPLYPEDYISISNKPCDLQCTTISRERQLLVPAHDGTFCRDTKHHGVCIQGSCQPVGCDGQLYSTLTVDRCGVCGGSGTSCRRVSGSYRRKALTQLGYAFVANIPHGATDIQIIERHKTENILALSDEGGQFFFNGNHVYDRPQNYHVAGTVFKYRRPQSLFSDGLEYMTAQGPTQQGLNVMYYNLNGKLPHITYEYTLPLSPQSERDQSERDQSGRDQSGRDQSGRDQSGRDQSGRDQSGRDQSGRDQSGRDQSGRDQSGRDQSGRDQRNQSERDQRNQSERDQRNQSERDESGRDESGRDESGRDESGRDESGRDESGRDESGRDESGRDESGRDESGRDESGRDQSERDQSERDQKEEEEQEEQEEVMWEIRTPSPPPPALLLYRPVEGFRDNDVEEHGPPSLKDYRSSSNSVHDSTEEEKSLLLLFPDSPSRSGLTSLNTGNQQLAQSPGMERPERDQIPSSESNMSGVLDMYRWKVSAYAPCSSTCTTGISSSYALCVRYDGTEVEESLCDSLTRPEPTHELCVGKECPARWETSGWSQCSRTCGDGYQYRTVRCWRMLSPGLDSSVYDSLCRSHDLHKPASRKVCSGPSCGPQWEVSEWAQCSARCGTQGLRTREVRCSMDLRQCNQTKRPLDRQPCEGPPCDRRWTTSDWGPCSGVCGEGRMVRAVLCRSEEGLVPENQCEPESRPLSVYPCGHKDCAPHWVQQEWQQCNASCGRGVRLRQVVCVGLESGRFKEFPDSSCDPQLRPETSSPCFQRPCSRWFSTTWSQCSKSCGSGVQVREVKCYHGDDPVTPGHSCDVTLRPETRQICEDQSCPTPPAVAPPGVSVAVDHVCQDKATANCSLVLKVKLCSHWYYRKACCQSCRGARS